MAGLAVLWSHVSRILAKSSFSGDSEVNGRSVDSVLQITGDKEEEFSVRMDFASICYVLY